MHGSHDLISAVAEGPTGARVGAFFDFDGTLIAGYSAAKFYADRLWRGDLSAREVAELAIGGAEVALNAEAGERALRRAVARWRGRSARDLEEMSERVFRERIASCIYPEARALVEAHQQRGHTVVIATSATRYQAGSTARDLGVDHLLCTEVIARDGVLTGEVAGPVLWGKGKAAAVERFAAEHGLSLRESHAYGNGEEDVAFLEAVGRPRAVNPQRVLAAVARERGWAVHVFDPPGGAVRPIAVVRTAAAVVALGAVVGLASAVGLLRRSRRDAANLVISLGCDLVLATAGVHVDVQGEEHLWSRRPAVFVFNHQSGIDPFVVGSLLRRDVTAVAKKQLARDPRVAPAGALIDVVYVDRSNIAQARAALAPAVERLKKGVSLAIAPEGTRSPTPRLGRFKKGAFHVALQAGVPIVPIVIRNSGEIMAARSNVVRSGTVDVRVLPPVETAGWSPESLDAHVEEVRRLFLDTLTRWTSTPAGGDAAWPSAAAVATRGADQRRPYTCTT